jgi:hypothetical protein
MAESPGRGIAAANRRNLPALSDWLLAKSGNDIEKRYLEIGYEHYIQLQN